MERLVFEKPIFESGMNTTFRAGEKWKERAHVGDMVELYSTDGVFHGYGRVIVVVSAKMIEFFDGPLHSFVEKEHDPCCRNYNDLRDELNEMYPDINFSDACGNEEVVTCIVLKIFREI